jgi:hypothetical protein
MSIFDSIGAHRLVQPSERQFHLGLDPCDLSDLEAGRLIDSMLQQRGLAETSLAPDHEHSALALSDVLEQPVHVLALADPAEERRGALDGHALKRKSRGESRSPGQADLRPGG